MPTFNAPAPGRRARRPVTPRDLPALFLGFALVLGVFAVAIPVMGKLAMAKESDLKFVAGSVQQAPGWARGKGGSKLPIIIIRVKMDDGLYDLHEQDLSHSREIMNLRPGDRITARVMPFAGYYHNIWELKRDGVTIQSYQETYLFQAATNERGVIGSLAAGLISLILLIAALVLRMHFGAWRDSTPSLPADAAGYVQRP
ncbi:MAG: hypothetical protein ABSD63_15890 [Candidatus Korobacteraceae bacterium]